MKLNQYGKYYHQFFKSMKKRVIKYKTIRPVNDRQHRLVLSKFCIKLLKEAGISNPYPVSSVKIKTLNPRDEIKLAGDILLNGVTYQFSYANAFSVYFRMNNKPYHYCNKSVKKVFHAKELQDIDPLNVDYYTEDEALIFQYNTMFEYDRLRSIVQFADLVHNHSTVLNIYQAVLKLRTRNETQKKS